jgi:hypothetical protein
MLRIHTLDESSGQTAVQMKRHNHLLSDSGNGPSALGLDKYTLMGQSRFIGNFEIPLLLDYFRSATGRIWQCQKRFALDCQKTSDYTRSGPPSHSNQRGFALRSFLFKILCAIVAFVRIGTAESGLAQDNAFPLDGRYQDWKHGSSFFLNTTPEGADLPASALVEQFPVLLRLHQGFFNFQQAMPFGEDLRFSLPSGESLPYQIEHWDPREGVASIWVRVPVIKGNSRSEIRMHWGNSDAKSESNGATVFNASNGFASVFHMDEPVQDATRTLLVSDQGTTATPGIVGAARHLSGGQGIFCGDRIESFPVGSEASSTHAWFRPMIANARVLGWGNEAPQGKIIMDYRSPASVQMECYFSGANITSKSAVPMSHWVHVVHTVRKGESLLYINGELDSAKRTDSAPLNIQCPARMWIGGWYSDYRFVGDIDEVRISQVARSADWIRLEYANQKPLQTLTGHLVQPGNVFSVEPIQSTVREGKSATFTARAEGAQKVLWLLRTSECETVVASDQFDFTFHAGRISNDESVLLQFKAIYADEIKRLDIPIILQEDLPEPDFTLHAPSTWDGREKIEVNAEIANREAMRLQGVDDLKVEWTVSGLATDTESAANKLILHRSHNSGTLTVTATISNGGEAVSKSLEMVVTEPSQDAWIERLPSENEIPVDNQFYARGSNNEALLFYNGTLTVPADEVFLKLYADDKLSKTERQKPLANGTYSFILNLAPGLIKYRVEFGSTQGGIDRILYTASNIVCGDAYIIEGQSNALATDTGEDAPSETSDWIRSYGSPNNAKGNENLWCNPVWKARNGEKAELGYWGMELAKRLVQGQQVPICIFNGAVGGTRIDQHQRNDLNRTDLDSIYGRLLWRIQQARLTHGIRAVLWHQGENDQGADGPDGGYGWETYEKYFVTMSAAWKQDYPNLQHYYVYQIFPNACSMGNGNGDMLREVQRTMTRLYSNMDVIATLGVEPPGGCHYPLSGWATFADLVQPLIERDFYGKPLNHPITSPNLKQARFTSSANDELALEFDQPIAWDEALVSEFYLDGEKARVASGTANGNVLTIKLSESSTAQRLSYLSERDWSQKRLLKGQNGLAALTFCNVPIALWR